MRARTLSVRLLAFKAEAVVCTDCRMAGDFAPTHCGASQQLHVQRSLWGSLQFYSKGRQDFVKSRP